MDPIPKLHCGDSRIALHSPRPLSMDAPVTAMSINKALFKEGKGRQHTETWEGVADNILMILHFTNGFFLPNYFPLSSFLHSDKKTIIYVHCLNLKILISQKKKKQKKIKYSPAVQMNKYLSN